MRLALMAAKALRTYFDEVHHWALTKDLSDSQNGGAAVRNGTATIGVTGGKPSILLAGAGWLSLPNIQLGDNWSYSAWVNVTSYDQHVHLLSTQPNDNPFRFLKIAGQGVSTQGNPYLADGTAGTQRGLAKKVPTGVWSLVTVTFEKGVGIKFYLGDELIGSSAFGLLALPNKTFFLGSDGSEKSFAAYRNVRIWNKAISVGTIRQILNLG